MTMFRYLLKGLLCAPMLSLLLMCAGPAQAKRVALVIGNDDYENVVDLKKAVNDASALGQTLKDLDFEVTAAENLARGEMSLMLEEFTAKLDKGDEALFFFAGHGVQIDGQNYLLPTDIPNPKPDEHYFVESQAIGVHEVLDPIIERGSRVAILILDACRNNPFRQEGTRGLGGTRGLAPMPAPEGTFIMYSAAAGQAALDTLGDDDPHPNSVFTRSFVPVLKTPGLKLTETIRRVRRKVRKLAATIGHKQVPEYSDQVIGEFYFMPRSVEASASSRFGATRDQDETLWTAIKDSDKASNFEFYLKRFPKGRHSALAELKVKQLKETKVAVGVYPEKPPSVGEELSKESGAARIVKMFDLFCLSLLPEIAKVKEAAAGRNFTELRGAKLKKYRLGFQAEDLRAWRYQDSGGEFILTAGRPKPDAQFVQKAPEFARSENYGCSLIIPAKDPRKEVLNEMVGLLGRDPEDVLFQSGLILAENPDETLRVHAWTGKTDNFVAFIHYYAPMRKGRQAILSAMAFVKD